VRVYPNARLVGVASPDRAQLDAFASTFGIDDATTDYAQIIERPDVDIVHIGAPPSEMPDLAIRAARAGKHMILGKPMALTAAQADAMVQAVDASGVMCMPFQGIMRLRGAGLKTRIDAGEIGDVVVLHQTSRWSIAEDWYRSGRPGWFADPAHVPGGALIDEGIYAIDFFRWITASEIVRVEAHVRNLVHTDIPVEDWGMASFEFASGVFATLEASWTINAPRATGPSPKQNAVVRLEVVGTRGEMIDQWFRDPGRAVLAAGARDWVYERQSEEPFGAGAPVPLAHLIECLETGQPTVCTIHDARAAFVAALAAYESARQGRAVPLSV